MGGGGVGGGDHIFFALQNCVVEIFRLALTGSQWERSNVSRVA